MKRLYFKLLFCLLPLFSVAHGAMAQTQDNADGFFGMAFCSDIPGEVSSLSQGNETTPQMASLSTSQKAQDQPPYFNVKTVEGVDMLFTVVSEEEKTCQVGGAVNNSTNFFYYAVDKSTSGKLTIPEKANGYKVIGIETIAFKECSGITMISMPYSLKYIHNQVFYGCSGLTSVAIGNSVASIGNSAFEGCSSLTTVTIPNSVTSLGYNAFQGCSGLTSVSISNSLTSIGDYVFSSCSSLSAVTIPNSVTNIGVNTFRDCRSLASVTIPNSVTSISTGVFYGCVSLTSVSIPNSVTSIESYAFGNCSGLTHITIPNSVTSIGSYAFVDCSGLASITIPNSTTNIGDHAFSGTAWYNNQPDGVIYAGRIAYECKGVMPEGTKITLKDGIVGIADYAFSGCSGLTSVTIPNSVIRIGQYAFWNCSGLTSVTIPNSVTSIGGGAFSGCIGLTSITIPNSVTSIGDAAFSSCIGLTSITIPNSMTSIGNSVFSGCRSLTSVSIPNSVTSIGNNAFDNCARLSSITIPNSVTSIGSYAFSYCIDLTSITIPESVTSIGDNTFSGCYILSNLFINNSTLTSSNNWGATLYDEETRDGLLIKDNTVVKCRSWATSVTVPNSVISIGNLAFQNCISLTSVTIPNSVTSIGEYAFSGCTSLTSVTIPNSVTSICNSTFQGCFSLTSITIPNSVTSIGNNAFDNCARLSSITIPNSVTSIGSYAFSYCIDLTSITIPESVTSIGDNAFSGCYILSDLFVNNSALTSYNNWGAILCDEETSDGLLIKDNTVVKCRSWATSVTIPENVTSIGERAFGSCRNLTSVSIPDNVTNIGRYAFSGCSSLTSITVGNNISSIGVNAITSGATIYTPISRTLFTLWNAKYNNIKEVGTGRKLEMPRLSATCNSASAMSLSVENAYLGLTNTLIVGGNVMTLEEENLTIKLNGLEPNTQYDISLTLAYEDASYILNASVTTASLTLTTQQPRVISEGNVIVAAQTNLDDEEANVGFEWRRIDWTDDFDSKTGGAYLYEGTMEGYIRSINSNFLWKYRPYYTTNAGNTFYGEWKGLDPSDYSYFEPTVHTYAAVTMTGTSATVKGYAMRGTDNIISQGFMYWLDNTSFSLRRKATSIPSNVTVVQANGNVMTATFENLEYESQYSYVAFVTTSEGETFYGEVQTFSTSADPDGIKELKDSKNLGNSWFTIDGRKLDGKPRKPGLYINGGKKVLVK